MAVAEKARVPLSRGKYHLVENLTAVDDYGAATIDGVANAVGVYISWGTGTSAGTIKLETASDIHYPGTWVVLATVSWSVATSQDVIHVIGALGAMRVRVSSTIVGGTVSADVVISNSQAG
jgi:hypothetical protein